MSNNISLKAVINTSKGDINIELFPEQVPVTVANFINLCSHKFYDGLPFHRVIPNFMIQGGCPLGDGRGGPGYQFEDEFVPDLKHDRPGRLSMANAGPNTNGSQFFITHVPTPWLDNHHTIFGTVVSAKDQNIVDSIKQGDTIETITIEDDVTDLMKQQKENIDQWNEILE
ncbi:MAG TPA: peptidylprolyl isomerase [Balneolales bacterium]|nr:peptidylprolyl isomerase [Balneolales bacterium]HYX07810.1 peptidylprolyl isomerase [Bacteroidales bacterium]